MPQKEQIRDYVRFHAATLKALLATYSFHLGSTIAVVVVGVVLATTQVPKPIVFVILGAVGLAAVLALALKRRPSHKTLLTLLTFAVGGIFFAANHKDLQRTLLHATLPKGSVLAGTIVRLNHPHKKKFRTTLALRSIKSPAGKNLDAPSGAVFEVVTPFEVEGFGLGDDMSARGNLLATSRIKDKNYQNYLLRRKRLATVFVYAAEDLVRVEAARRPGLMAVLKAQREWILWYVRQKLEHYVGSPAVGLAYGIITGDKSALPKNILEDFRLTGTFHVLAVSGMHASIISLLFYNLFRVVGMRRRSSLSLVMFLVLPAYLFITGSKVSIVRTYLMLLLGFGLMVSGRRTPLLVVLQLAFLVMVLVHPVSLYSIGLQLSFSAVFGIFVMIELLRVFRIRGRLLQFVLVSFGAQTFTNPIACYYFGYANPLALAYNLFVPFCIGVSLAITIAILLSPAKALNAFLGDVLTLLNHGLFWVLEKTKITFPFFYLPLKGEGFVCAFWWLAQGLLVYFIWVHGRYLRSIDSESALQVDGKKSL